MAERSVNIPAGVAMSLDDQDRKPGEIGGYWLSRNRHGVWSLTWWDTGRQHVRSMSLRTTDFDEAQMRLAEAVTLERLREVDDRAARDACQAIVDRWQQYG